MWRRGILLGLCSLPLAATAGCPPAGTDLASLRELKQHEFALADTGRRDALALQLVDCLADPDPELRDGIAYEGLTAWLRGDQLTPAARTRLLARLYALLDGEDPQGFARPFAALALAEVARTDRVRPWLDEGQRDAMVTRAADYLAAVRDYRGYDPREGWRHGVAHGADWLMQLALNEKLSRAQAERMLAAIARQVVPESPHAYVFGEPARLARPVLFIARRGVLDEADWQAWFATLQQRLGGGAQAYRDPAWLARKHDLTAFSDSLYVQADQSADARVQGLKTALMAAAKAPP